jgi:hypothetical protein
MSIVTTMDKASHARGRSSVPPLRASRTRRLLRRQKRSSELTGVSRQSFQSAVRNTFREQYSPSPPRPRASSDPLRSSKWQSCNGLRSKLRVYKDKASGAGKDSFKTHTAVSAMPTILSTNPLDISSAKENMKPLKVAKRRPQHQIWPTPPDTLLQ